MAQWSAAGAIPGGAAWERNPDPIQFFTSGFRALTKHTPFSWQTRLFLDYFLKNDIPPALDLPTGLGKTSVMAIWLLARQAGAALPRRLVYVVDRRAVVDQATEEAEKIRANAGDAALRISTLRGQFADNKEWLSDPASPAIIVGTVDMIGSRLLFEGYGVSRRMRPYHAGLLGVDTLVVLDESHLVPPFERLLEQIAQNADLRPKEDTAHGMIPRFHLLPLSATGKDKEGSVFRLEEEDREDTPVEERLEAVKRLQFEAIGNKTLEARLAEKAWVLCEKGALPARILVYCNNRDVAGRTLDAIRKLSKPYKIPDENFQLIVGARRVYERENARKKLEELRFFSEEDKPPPASPAFVIATSAGEVGVDLDADHMVMDLVPFERMVQRLGRVNRLGGKGREARIVAIEEPDNALPDDLKERAKKTAALLQELPQAEDVAFQVGPGALVDLKENAGEQRIRDASSPDPLYPALTRPLVDAWSMTSLEEHTGRPEVQPWLRGWETDDRPQTALVWRRYLPVRIRGGEAGEKEVNAFFAAAPPHLTEKLETESYRVHDWLKKRVKKFLDAAEESRKAGGEGTPEAEKPLGKDDVVGFVLGSGNEPERRPLKLAELNETLENKQRFLSSIAGRTMILDARVGGLSEDGLLDDKSDTLVSAADEDGWRGAEKEQPPLAPFRVRREVRRDDGEEPAAAPEPRVSDENWHPVHAFDTKRDGEGNAEEQLIIEKWRAENPDEDARSVARRPQSLSEHQDWAAKRAKELVDRLGLECDLADAIVIAARLHDEGKKARRWQDAFHTKRDGRPYAKTDSRRVPNFDILGGYRHEFGSLFHLDCDNEFSALSDEMKDLVRHLIAAHHGGARPVIGTDGCEDLPPSALEAKAREVTLRFARLQKRFGPWGLAWLEALMRAADQQASRDLDEGRAPDG